MIRRGSGLERQLHDRIAHAKARRVVDDLLRRETLASRSDLAPPKTSSLSLGRGLGGEGRSCHRRL